MNLTNEHGNTPLHYACFWSYQGIADDLIQAGGIVTISNRFGESGRVFVRAGRAFVRAGRLDGGGAWGRLSDRRSAASVLS